MSRGAKPPTGPELQANERSHAPDNASAGSRESKRETKVHSQRKGKSTAAKTAKDKSARTRESPGYRPPNEGSKGDGMKSALKETLASVPHGESPRSQLDTAPDRAKNGPVGSGRTPRKSKKTQKPKQTTQDASAGTKATKLSTQSVPTQVLGQDQTRIVPGSKCEQLQRGIGPKAVDAGITNVDIKKKRKQKPAAKAQTRHQTRTANQESPQRDSPQRISAVPVAKGTVVGVGRRVKEAEANAEAAKDRLQNDLRAATVVAGAASEEREDNSAVDAVMLGAGATVAVKPASTKPAVALQDGATTSHQDTLATDAPWTPGLGDGRSGVYAMAASSQQVTQNLASASDTDAENNTTGVEPEPTQHHADSGLDLHPDDTSSMAQQGDTPILHHDAHLQAEFSDPSMAYYHYQSWLAAQHNAAISSMPPAYGNPMAYPLPFGMIPVAPGGFAYAQPAYADNSGFNPNVLAQWTAMQAWPVQPVVETHATPIDATETAGDTVNTSAKNDVPDAGAPSGASIHATDKSSPGKNESTSQSSTERTNLDMQLIKEKAVESAEELAPGVQRLFSAWDASHQPS